MSRSTLAEAPALTGADPSGPTAPTPARGAATTPRGRGRRRRGWVVGLAVVLAVVAAACSQSNTPQTYANPVTENNFIQGCTGASTGTSTTTTLASKDLCTCIYNVTKASIPMSSQDEKTRDGGKAFANYGGQTFQQINGELKTNPNKIPADLQKAWAEKCGSQGFSTTTTKASSSGGPTTTAASTGGPTTTKG